MTSRRVGIIGCGWVGTNRHIPSYQADDRSVVHAVYDHNLYKAQKAAAANDIARSYENIDEFLAEDLDIVSICTPPWTHAELAKRSLEAGCNVLSEKPMAMTPTQAKEMNDVAERTGQTLGIVHNFLYASSMRKARKQVRKGNVGEIKSVIGFQTSSPRRKLPSWYPELPGELFYDESPHLLYLIEEFLGEVSVASSTLYRELEKKQTVQTVNANLVSEEGKTGTLTMTFDAPLSEWHLVVIGSKKVLIVDIFRDIFMEFDKEESHNAKDVVGTSLSAIVQELSGMTTTGMKLSSGDLLFGMGELTRRFIDSIEENSSPPVDGAEGARIVQYMHDILEEGGVNSSPSETNEFST